MLVTVASIGSISPSVVSVRYIRYMKSLCLLVADSKQRQWRDVVFVCGSHSKNPNNKQIKQIIK